jgi:nucleoside-diphosphate-sugar epimerase
LNFTVTGGLGFIGSHVVDGLLEAGHRVRIVDSTVAAVTDGAEYDGHPRCTVVRESVQDWMRAGGDFEGDDWVIHAASPVGPAGILGSQGQLGGEIVAVAQMVIDAAIDSGSALCTFSSAEVYGRSGQLGEGDSIVVPTRYNARLEYAIAKTLTEAMTLNSRHRGLRGLVVRPFNVAGARQSSAAGFVLPTFVQSALDGTPLPVFAGGDQVRAFLAASDLSRFVVEHLDTALESGEPLFNLGNPENATTVWNLAERVVHVLGSDSPIEHCDATRIHGPFYEEAESFEKLPVLGAAAAVGWTPRVSLDALILETAEFYRRHGDMRTGHSMQSAHAVA